MDWFTSDMHKYDIIKYNSIKIYYGHKRREVYSD